MRSKHVDFQISLNTITIKIKINQNNKYLFNRDKIIIPNRKDIQINQIIQPFKFTYPIIVEG